MQNTSKFLAVVVPVAAAAIFGVSLSRNAAAQGQPNGPISNGDRGSSDQDRGERLQDAIADNARTMLHQGRQIFRFDTFGDEAFWGDTLKLHRAISGARQGGVGPGVSPQTALPVGLKVDIDALSPSVVPGVKNGIVEASRQMETGSADPGRPEHDPPATTRLRSR